MWSFMIVVCGVFFSTVSGGQIYPSNEVQSVALNSDFHKNWTIQTAPNEEAKSIILYYHSGVKDPKVAWHGSVTKLGKSTFNRSLNVNIIENTEVVVEFSNIQEAMVLYLMVHFVDDKSGEMHAFYSNVKIVLKVNGKWANWGSWNACSLTCGVGKQTRRRRCTDPSPENGGSDCRGSKIETKNCFIRRCTAWSSWSCQHCSKTAIRTRTCHHGCPGETTETKEMCQIESSCFPDKVLSYNTDLWGSWRSWEYCPKGTWVVKLQTRIESHQGGGDDTALNAISLRCNNDVGTTITSGYTNWGTWRAESQKCINGFYGGMLKFESSLGSDDDDTSTNAIRLICQDDNQWYKSGEGGWGSWTQSTFCPASYKIVGLQTQIESDQGSDDDTSLNGVRLLCRYFG